jgi:hypothetical protein
MLADSPADVENAKDTNTQSIGTLITHYAQNVNLVLQQML